MPLRYKGACFEKSFFPTTLKLWNLLPKDIQHKDLVEFKLCIKQRFKPPKYKHFHKGSKLGNTLLTRIRVGRSFLNQHKFTIGFSSTPECICHFKTESPNNYFMDCFLYTLERQRMFSLIEHYVPNFPRLNISQKLDIILNGVDPEDLEYTTTNTTITSSVQEYILATKRFTAMED